MYIYTHYTYVDVLATPIGINFITVACLSLRVGKNEELLQVAYTMSTIMIAPPPGSGPHCQHMPRMYFTLLAT